MLRSFLGHERELAFLAFGWDSPAPAWSSRHTSTCSTEVLPTCPTRPHHSSTCHRPPVLEESQASAWHLPAPPAWPIMQSSRYRAWPAAPPKQASSLGPLRLCTGLLRGRGSRAYLLLTEPMPKLTFQTQVPPDLQPSSMSPQASRVSWVHLFRAPNSSLV